MCHPLKLPYDPFALKSTSRFFKFCNSCPAFVDHNDQILSSNPIPTERITQFLEKIWLHFCSFQS